MSLTSANGKHLTVNCPICKKRDIRSDHFKKHFAKHKTENPLVVTTAEEFVEYYEDLNLELVGPCIVPMTLYKSKMTYDSGFCWDCCTRIKNPNPYSKDALADHICKDKQPLTHNQPDPKALWKEIGQKPMSVSQKRRWVWYDTNVKDAYSNIDGFMSHVLETDRKANGETALPRGAPLPAESSIFKTLKEDDDLKDMFDFCDTEEELLETLLCKLKGIEAKDASAAAKWNTLKAKYDALLAKHS